MKRVRKVNVNEVPQWDTLYEKDGPTCRSMFGSPQMRKDLSDAIPLNSTVLDVGTGAGLGPKSLQRVRPDIRWSGMDFSPWVAEWTQKHSGVKWVGFLVADIRDGIPEKDGSYDVVMATELLEHLDDPAAAVAELARVARSRIIVTTPINNGMDSPFHVWSFSPDNILDLLKPYGGARVAITRENRQILGVCILGDDDG